MKYQELDIKLSEKHYIRISNKKGRIEALIFVSKTDHCFNDILYKYRIYHLPIAIAAIAINNENDPNL